MKEVSNKFHEYSKAPSRQSSMIVRIWNEENSSFYEGNYTYGNKRNFTKDAQISDGVSVSAYALADYSPRRIKLDGSFATVTDGEGENFFEVGFLSNVSNANGVFENSTYLQIDEALNCDTGLTIVFDYVKNEYPINFTVKIGNQTITYTNNDKSYIYIPDSRINEQDKTVSEIRVTISDWSVPFHRAQIAEIHRGLSVGFTSNDIFSLDITQGIDITGQTMILGDFNLTVSDPDNMFDIYNPNGYGKLLKPNSKILVYNAEGNGDDFSEYVLIGTFYLTEISSQNHIATITGTDVFGYLDRITLSKEEEMYSMYSYPEQIDIPLLKWEVGMLYVVDEVVIYNNRIYKCLQRHWSDDSITPEDAPDYWEVVKATSVVRETQYLQSVLLGLTEPIDDSQDLLVTANFREGESKAEILRQLTQYGIYRFISSENGRIRAVDRYYDQVFANTIDLDQSYQFPDVQLDHERVKGIYYTVYNYNESETNEQIESEFTKPIPYYYDEDIGRYVVFNNYYYPKLIDVGTMYCPLYNETWIYALSNFFNDWTGNPIQLYLSTYGARIIIIGTEAQFENFVNAKTSSSSQDRAFDTTMRALSNMINPWFRQSRLSAKTIDDVSDEYFISQDSNAISEEQEHNVNKKYSIDNKSIDGYGTAKSLMPYQLYFYNKNYRVKCDWRGDTSIDLLDTVTVNDKYGNQITGLVIENKISYNGALRQETVIATTEDAIGG